MLVRLGYVAMAIDLKDCSPSKTITFTQYSKLPDDETKISKLKRITKENLNNTKRILLYNKAHNIKVYRITSKIVPLINHPDIPGWDYIDDNYEILKQIKQIIKDNEFRISAHPDHFTILSSPRYDVIETSIQNLVYHNNIMVAFGLDTLDGKLVLHIGGKYDSKEKTIERFKKNFLSLNECIRDRLILENDDKVYDTIDVLEICEDLNVPMVLDIHHHRCNNRGENLEDYLERIYDTWSNQALVPKIHISSPKSEKDFRAHADDIDSSFFFNFIYKAKKLDRDIDVMIEAKNKNIALKNIMKHIKNNSNIKVIDDSSFEL